MSTPSEMSQCIPAAEKVLHSVKYALKIQGKHLLFFPDPYCVVLLVVVFWVVFFEFFLHYLY